MVTFHCREQSALRNVIGLHYRRLITVVFWLAFCFPVAAQNLLELPQSRLSELQTSLRQHGELYPVEDLRPVVEEIEKALQTPEMDAYVKKHQGLEHWRELVLDGLYSVDVEFRVHDPNYPYKIPFEGAFPYRPTMNAIKDAANFIQAVDNIGGAPDLPQIDKSQGPDFFDGLGVLPTVKKGPEEGDVVAPSGERTPEDLLINDPVGEYRKYKERLDRYGENAPFPEWKATVDSLLADLNSEASLKAAKESPVLNELHRMAMQSLNEIMLEAPQQTPTSNPFSVAYPYRPTLSAILQALTFFDVMERNKYDEFADVTGREFYYHIQC